MGDETEAVVCKCACGCGNEDAPVKIGIVIDCGISGRCRGFALTNWLNWLRGSDAHKSVRSPWESSGSAAGTLDKPYHLHCWKGKGLMVFQPTGPGLRTARVKIVMNKRRKFRWEFGRDPRPPVASPVH